MSETCRIGAFARRSVKNAGETEAEYLNFGLKFQLCKQTRMKLQLQLLSERRAMGQLTIDYSWTIRLRHWSGFFFLFFLLKFTYGFAAYLRVQRIVEEREKLLGCCKIGGDLTGVIGLDRI